MALALHDLLERRFGVDEDEFAAALVDFIDRVGPVALVAIDPDEYFAEHQKAALRRVGASLSPLASGDLGPIAALAAATAALVNSSLTVAAVAKRLDVDTSRVRQRLYEGSLYGFKHQGAWLVPSFQMRDRKLVSGLSPVIRALSPDLHPVSVARWFTTPNADLEIARTVVSPIAWLESGSTPDRVAGLATAIDQL